MTVLGSPEEAFEPLPLRDKLSLMREIIRTYAQARRYVRGGDIRTALEGLRADVPLREPDRGTFVSGLRLGRAVTRVLRPLPMDTRCLTRSLVLKAMLTRRGIESSVVIGVRNDDRFQAHAWVEHQGAPLLPDEAFERLVEFPDNPSAERVA